MKVFELINQLKGTTATLEQIKEWSYMNRISPCVLKDGLELDCEYPESLVKACEKVCSQVGLSCYPDCWNTFFEMEITDEHLGQE
ncbi:MAG TPA: hypothetical protein VFC58_09370 [Desulfosporosinus sp.]|nr:hypothetical protein [Desulfosporosinus sp.]